MGKGGIVLVNQEKLKELIESMDENCWIEDGVSDLVIGWIESDLNKIGFGYDEIENAKIYDELSLKIGNLCKDFIRSLLQ